MRVPATESTPANNMSPDEAVKNCLRNKVTVEGGGEEKSPGGAICIALLLEAFSYSVF